ncbi:TetR/AcrR family transcriptional regulator [Nocardia sp. NPDC059180]|uniref:TetR/AcrR family transcriptional regulator n=1 Tax=Nocardia sp. NPDC059180 TaxID=3346761 RepID=UPI0036B58017
MGEDYLESGRVRQKLRTREDLIAAARRLIEGGDTPRVEEAAEASGISRTTAYRYFRTQAELLAAAFPEVAVRSLLPSPAPEDTVDRVHAVTSSIIDVVERTESQQRAMLRLSLGDAPHELPLRKGRAIGWLEEALEPSRETMGAESIKQLAIAIRSICGIEARVWLSDVAGLDSHDIRALQLWAATALVERAAVEPPPGRSSS